MLKIKKKKLFKKITGLLIKIEKFKLKLEFAILSENNLRDHFMMD